MIRTMLLDGKTGVGPGQAYAIAGEKRTFQAWLSASGGTSSIVVEASNDPRAVSSPSSAAWTELGNFALSGASDAASFVSDAPYMHVRARTAIMTGAPAVSVAMVTML